MLLYAAHDSLPARAQTGSSPSRATLYQQALGAGPFTPYTSLNADQQQFLAWLAQYSGTPYFIPYAELMPQYVGGALRQMYLKAAVSSTQVSGKYPTFYAEVMANASTPMWSLCANSVMFIMHALELFNIPSHMVQSWFVWDDSHATMEYWSTRFQKWVWYDALYGEILIDAQGVPASFSQIEEEITAHGFAVASIENNWRYQPVQFFSPTSTTFVHAVDSTYDFFNSYQYPLILEEYFAVTGIMDPDNPVMNVNAPLPGQPANGALGRWLMYDNTAFELQLAKGNGYDQAHATQLINTVQETYSTLYGGRYYLTWLRPVAPTNVVVDAGPDQ
jgi:hypothetical protein